MPTPATVEISETNGNANGGSGSPYSSPTVHDGIANINFGSLDDFNLDVLAHPLVLSVSGKTYSVTKWVRFHVSDMGTSISIANLKCYKFSGAYITAEFLGSNMNDEFNTPEIEARAIQTYATRVAASGSGAFATPYSGNGFDLGGPGGPSSDRYWSPTGGILTSLPGNNNLTVGGLRAGTIAAPGYSDYVILCNGGDGSAGSPTPPSSVTPPNQKVIAFTYDES